MRTDFKPEPTDKIILNVKRPEKKKSQILKRSKSIESKDDNLQDIKRNKINTTTS